MSFELSKTSKERLVGVDPSLVLLIEESLKVSPIDFGIPQYGGLRTAPEQNSLFKKGVSKCDGFKTKSNHQTGKAVDVYAFVNGKASWDTEHLALIAGVILATAFRLGIKIRWGGTFGSNEMKGWDRPHFELA